MCTTAIRLGGLVLAAVAVTGSQPSTAAGAGRPPPRLRSRPGPRRRPRRPAHTGGEPPRLLPDPARTPGAVASTDLATGLRPGLQPPGPAAGHHRAGRRRRRGTPPGEARPGWLSALGAETCGRSPRHIRGRDGRDVGAPAKGLPRASSARDHRGVIKRHRRGPPSSTIAPCDWCGRRRGAPSPCARPRRPAPVPTARRHRTGSVTFAPACWRSPLRPPHRRPARPGRCPSS
jgi:hypothetical protein